MKWILVVGVVFASISSAADWSDQVVAQVHLNFMRDRRTLMERLKFRINEEGIITGQDFLDVARPLSPRDYEQFLRMQGITQNMDTQYAEYLQRLTQRTLTILALNRVIDREAMKLKIAPNPPDWRARYAVESILAENALMRGKSRENLRISADEERYEWLKEAVGSRSVRFNVNWNYRKGPAGDLLNWMSYLGEPVWPAFKLTFAKLPATLSEFKEQVYQKLIPDYRIMMRQRAWFLLLQEKYRRGNFRGGDRIAPEEYAGKYAELKDSVFKITEKEAAFLEIKIQGDEGARFRARFDEELRAEQARHVKELSALETKQLEERVQVLRETVPQEILERLEREFQAPLTSGTLKIDVFHRIDRHNGLDPLSHPKLRSFFHPVLSRSSLFVTSEMKPDSQTTAIFLLVAVNPVSSYYLPENNAQVKQAVENAIRMDRERVLIRDLVRELFTYNPLEIKASFCASGGFACVSLDPDRLSQEVSPDIMQRVFEAPNPHL